MAENIFYDSAHSGTILGQPVVPYRALQSKNVRKRPWTPTLTSLSISREVFWLNIFIFMSNISHGIRFLDKMCILSLLYRLTIYRANSDICTNSFQLQPGKVECIIIHALLQEYRGAICYFDFEIFWNFMQEQYVVFCDIKFCDEKSIIFNVLGHYLHESSFHLFLVTLSTLVSPDPAPH